MNFEYYLGQSLIDSGDLKHFWGFDSSSGSGNFSSGSPLELLGTSDDENFTCLLTYSKQYTGRCLLLSNIDSGYNGFSIGITDDNMFFIDTYSQDYNETFVFDQINLSKKNTAVIQRIGDFFIIYNYNNVARNIFERQYFSFKSIVNNSGANIYFGGNANYPQDYSIPYFSGTVDQFAYFSEAYNEPVLLSLLSGFQPETSISGITSYGRVTSNESISYLDSIAISGSDYSYFYSFMVDFNESVVSNYTGQGVALITGGLYGSGWLSSGYYGDSNYYNPCLISGTTGYYGHTWSGKPSGTFQFSDTVNYSVGNSGNMSITHSIRYIYPLYSMNPFTINHSFCEKWGYTTSYSGGVIDSGYYSGFYMNGTVSQFGESMILGTRTGISPGFFGIEATKNSIDGSFTALPEHSGIVQTVYLNGDITGNFSLSGRSIGIYNYTGAAGDLVIYDCFTGNNVMFYGLNGFCSGNFYPKSSILYSSDNSWSVIKRMRKQLYREVSSINLSYGRKILNVDADRLYDNDDSFWNYGNASYQVEYSGSYIELESGGGFLLLEDGGYLLFEQ